MRKLKHLSYSALAAWERDPETFYIERLAAHRIKRQPQGTPAAIGSAFDARIKNYLAICLWGPDRPDDLAFEALFEAQVEPQNRDAALPDSQYVFDAYVASGAAAALMSELEVSPLVPRFESERVGVVAGVPLLTKPDLVYAAPGGQLVVFDWKVRSFYSVHGASPTPGYRAKRRGVVDKPGKEVEVHKKFRPTTVHGMTVHAGCLSEFSEEYADQTALYAWVAGVEVGGDFLAALDELACRPGQTPGRPNIWVAEQRAAVHAAWQHTLIERFVRCWTHIEAEHVIPSLSRDESQAKQAMLERTATSLCGDEDSYYAKVGRKGWY